MDLTHICVHKGVRPLFLAISSGCHEVAEMLLSNGADVNVPNTVGSAPIIVASTQVYSSPLSQSLFLPMQGVD